MGGDLVKQSRGPERGIVFIIAAPSGGGKSTICKELLAHDPHLAFSVSYTSRMPRPRERDGVDYHFVSREQFRVKVNRGEFLEWAVYVDNFYGTDRAATEAVIDSGRDILLDIDIQGGDAIKAAMPDCVRIFILPPSRDELRQRLIDRGTNTPEDLGKRLATASNEVPKAAEYDYMVVNDDLAQAVAGVRTIIAAERLRVAHRRQTIGAILRSFEESL